MLNKILKGIGILLLACISFECLRAIPLLVPYPFFSHHTTIDEFTLYADSTINASTLSLVHEAIDRVRRSEIYTANRKHRIFLCFNEKKYAFFSSLAGKNKYSQGINIEPTGNIFISEPFITAIKYRYGPAFEGTLLEGSIAHVIAHEILHTVTTDQLGYWPSRKLPHWIKEGYAEYGASKREKNSDLAQQLWVETKRFSSLDQRNISPTRYQYIQSKLLIQYLVDIEGIRIDSILTTTLNEQEVIAALNKWYIEYSTALTLPPPIGESH